MRKQTYCRHLLLPALLAAASLTPLAARAQVVAETAPVSLNTVNTPVQNALRSLFTGAGIRNFKIDSDVQGVVNVSLSDVPLSVALKQVLGAANPPLSYDIQDGVYHVRAQASKFVDEAGAVSPQRLVRLPITPASGADDYRILGLQDGESEPNDLSQDHFTKIGIKHYDPITMADLITREGGIIVVPPNFVTPAGSGSGASATPTVTTVPSGPASGAASPFGSRPTGSQAAPSAAKNVLPEGIKRIYALESDNSLVIESSGTGIPGFSL
jgi:hypothetical protein